MAEQRIAAVRGQVVLGQHGFQQRPCSGSELYLTIQEAFSSPAYPCKYAEIFFYKVLNNFFACGFLGTSYNL